MTEDSKLWIRNEAESSRLGLRPECAEAIPGNWVGLEMLPLGSSLRAGDGFGFITTDRGTHDLRAPAAMRILEVNQQAIENPNLVKLSPTGLGWLMLVKLDETVVV